MLYTVGEHWEVSVMDSYVREFRGRNSVSISRINFSISFGKRESFRTVILNSLAPWVNSTVRVRSLPKLMQIMFYFRYPCRNFPVKWLSVTYIFRSFVQLKFFGTEDTDNNKNNCNGEFRNDDCASFNYYFDFEILSTVNTIEPLDSMKNIGIARTFFE